MRKNLYLVVNIFLVTTFLISVSPGRIIDKAELEESGLVLQNSEEHETVVVADKMTMQQLLQESRISGGLIVSAGCGTGREIAALAKGSSFIVQGLNSNLREIEKARKLARSLDLAGRLSFKHWSGGCLPYTDNLANVLFWNKPGVEADMTEIMRVLAPLGEAYILENNGWRKMVKPWPDEIDEWPHYRYDAGSTGASNDSRVGPPGQIQWEAGPRFMRSHEIETGFSSIVTAKGRLYYILDEGPIGITDARFPSKWSLVCRDAFNGILLWKNPLPQWGWQAWVKERENIPQVWLGTRTRSADVDRLMVVDGDTLYVTMSFGAPVSAIDGATGKVLMTYKETAGTVEFIFIDGVLIVRNNNPDPAIIAIRARDGKILWRRDAGIIIDRSLCAAAGKVFFHNRSEMISLGLRTGKELWKKETELRPSAVIAHEDAVLVMQSSITLALSAETGGELWRGPGADSRGRYPDIFIVNDLVWSGRPHFDARQIRTGEVVQKMDLQKVLESGHHRRCYTDRATINYMITGERGSEFLDLHENDHKRHNWFRGPCITGMMPANGLFYVPPHQCFCYPAVKMDGFFALSSQLTGGSSGSGNISTQRLEKGPAYAKSIKDKGASPEDWPTYRQNPKRSGATVSQVPADLNRLWSNRLGGNLTQAVVAGGRVFVAEKDAGTLHCLDIKSGKLLWSRTVAGRIDSPPGVHKGYVIFGSRDGFVYSFRASDGELAWCFRAAPEDRQIVSYDRMESVWPVHGSVLILDDLVYCSAGRSGFIDGGIYLYSLKAATGKIVYQTKLEGPYPDISQPSYAFHEDGYRSDLLTTDGRCLYMGRTALNRNLEVVEPERIHLVGTQRGDELEYRRMPGMRLVATGGFLNDTFWNRTWWMYSYVWPGFHYAQQAPKSGQMLVFDDQNTYTVKHYTTRNRHSPMLFPGKGYLLFADDNNNEPLFYRGKGEPAPIKWEPELPADTKWSIFQDAAVDKGPGFTRSLPAQWTSWVNVRIEAMVLANDKLIFAGSPDIVPDEDPLAAIEGRMGGVLKIISAKNGSPLAEYNLDSKPVFDGLIAAQGKLFITTHSGEIICLGQK
ncbi:MAG TPA: hypothetical protein DCY25_01140 [Bacteroidales bacterium]|nr:hypothetical protein [Bacteroidales bacterium]